MYTIKQAAVRAGVSIPLLRAWERRYGVVRPERTAAGYRLYDEDAIAVLSTMRRLVGSGWAPSEAARAIRDGEVPADVAESVPPAYAGGSDASPGSRLVDGAAAMSTTAVESALDEIFSRGSYEAIVDRVLMPALDALGEGWEAGIVDVAGEHLASAAVMRRLTSAYNAAGSPAGRAVLVGTPPGSRHELGPVAFSVALLRQGVPVTYLGTDVPVTSWVDAARHTSATAVVISVTASTDATPAAAVVRALRAAMPNLTIALGGRAAAEVPDETGDGSLLLDRGIVGSAGDLAARLAVPPRRRAT